MVAHLRGTFANCTHVLLEAWKVTVVWIECDDAIFFVANWIIVDILKYLY